MTTRRGFFSKLLGQRPSFSLDRFYANREPTPSATLPKFELRPGLPDPRPLGTAIGTPALSRRAGQQRLARKSKKDHERNS